MPNVGYGSNKKCRHVCPDGFKKVVVNNVNVSRATSVIFWVCVCFFLVVNLLRLSDVVSIGLAKDFGHCAGESKSEKKCHNFVHLKV